MENGLFALYVESAANPIDAIDATNNYWGTVNEEAIEDLIQHYMDDQTYAVVTYIPFSYGEFDIDDSTVTAVTDERGKTLPTSIALHQNFPNPFNAGTVIEFALPEATQISLSVYNILGQQVRWLASGRRSAGIHAVYFDGADDLGNPLSSGVFFCRLCSELGTETRKMVLLK